MTAPRKEPVLTKPARGMVLYVAVRAAGEEKILAGPFKMYAQQDEALAKARAAGHADAYACAVGNYCVKTR